MQPFNKQERKRRNVQLGFLLVLSELNVDSRWTNQLAVKYIVYNHLIRSLSWQYLTYVVYFTANLQFFLESCNKFLLKYVFKFVLIKKSTTQFKTPLVDIAWCLGFTSSYTCTYRLQSHVVIGLALSDLSVARYVPFFAFFFFYCLLGVAVLRVILVNLLLYTLLIWSGSIWADVLLGKEKPVLLKYRFNCKLVWL